MAVIKVPTSFNIDVEFEIPEFYRRILALLIDMLVEFFYIRIIIWLLGKVIEGSDLSEMTIDAIWMVAVLPILLYHVLFEATMNGQSIGKKIMGIKVVHENGGRASLSQFIIRWLLRVSDVWIVALIFLVYYNNGGIFRDVEGTLFFVGALAFLTTDIVLAVSSKKGQRIGDMLAHTILINTNARTSIEETVFQEVDDSYKPSFPQIMQLSDKDINAIKSILETARKKGDYNMAASAAEKIKTHLGIQTDMSPYDFLDVLLKDYNYLSVK